MAPAQRQRGPHNPHPTARTAKYRPRPRPRPPSRAARTVPSTGRAPTLLVIATLGPGSSHSVIALACATMPGFLRIARSQSLVVRRSGYVRAAVVLGRAPLSIQLRHVLPNALPPLLVFSMINIGSAIIAGTTLSFLGLGPKAPAPEWGSMLSTSRNYLAVAWAPAVFPGLAIALTVVALNIVGRDLQRRFERRESVPRA
ncbi:ABC transporter permease [Frankia sp. AgKG'84/4]|uniref:ABC transporter permease n=1 Tax=Frankia sp. AgKG'84/4 TaxID=573490 RepID=UPI0020106E11|nr:ABC transporter permease [Frankia sp. AgKG'84/4]MCL9792955.1 ABC transporter permease [Frankia sp. AgKG'84/4]